MVMVATRAVLMRLVLVPVAMAVFVRVTMVVFVLVRIAMVVVAPWAVLVRVLMRLVFVPVAMAVLMRVTFSISLNFGDLPRQLCFLPAECRNLLLLC